VAVTQTPPGWPAGVAERDGGRGSYFGSAVGHCAAEVDDVIGNHAEADSSLHSNEAFVAASVGGRAALRTLVRAATRRQTKLLRFTNGAKPAERRDRFDTVDIRKLAHTHHSKPARSNSVERSHSRSRRRDTRSHSRRRGHVREDLKLVAFLLGGILVMLGVIADRIH
jgi:hypothetical protein